MSHEAIQELALHALNADGEEREVRKYYLWVALERVAWSKANRLSLGAYERDRLVDALELAVYKALETYDPEKGTFLNWVSRPWKWAVSKALKGWHPVYQWAAGDDGEPMNLADEDAPERGRREPLPGRALERQDTESHVRAIISSFGLNKPVADVLRFWTEGEGDVYSRRLFFRNLAVGDSHPACSAVPVDDALTVYAYRRFWKRLSESS